MGRPRWWRHSGGPFILLGAVLGIALLAAALRLWIDPHHAGDDTSMAGLVTAVEVAVLAIARTRHRRGGRTWLAWSAAGPAMRHTLGGVGRPDFALLGVVLRRAAGARESVVRPAARPVVTARHAFDRASHRSRRICPR